MKKEKVVITGGAGFIGSHIADRCIEDGFETHIIDNMVNGKMERVNSDAVFHEVDIINYEDIAPIIKDAKWVFHEAALPRVQFSIDNPIESNEANVVGTINVLKAGSEGGVEKVIYASSGSAYGEPETLPVIETMPANPMSPYALQKYVGEMYCKVWSAVYGLDTVVLRYFNIYGRRMDPDGAYALVIGKFAKLMKEGKPLTVTGDGTQTRDFTHISDAVEANMLAANCEDAKGGEMFNIGFGARQSVNKVAKIFGGEVEYIAPRLEPHDNEADHGKAKKCFGWEPKISLEEGIADVKEEWGLS